MYIQEQTRTLQKKEPTNKILNFSIVKNSLMNLSVQLQETIKFWQPAFPQSPKVHGNTISFEINFGDK